MRVSKLQDTDYERIHSIFLTVFDKQKWEQDFFVAWSTRIKDASIGAYSEDGSLLAYAILTQKETSSKQPYWFLEFMAAAPEAQGLGLGSTLLQTLLRMNPNISLVPLNNQKLIQWYERHGFRVVTRQTDRFGDPELIMSTIQTTVGVPSVLV